MKLSGTTLELSATDLAAFLGCRHRTALDMAVAQGARERLKMEPDPLLEILWARGLEHERLYVESLKAKGLSVTDLTEFQNGDRDVHVAKTLEALRGGAEVIVQGALRDECWFGKPDVMLRIAKPSNLGTWSYEVVDTKLSKETKAGTILQLGLYSEMLAVAQGMRPEYFHVVTPDKTNPQHTFRLDDYAAYFRMVRAQMLETVALDHGAVAEQYYPEPVPHCDICRWDMQCRRKRREDDHLSLIAGISRVHRRELESRDIRTLESFVRAEMDFKPSRGSIETYVSLREQARLQFESRGKDVPVFELRAINEDMDEGLCRLPEPSPGDIFLDLEGDPFAGEGGREYLFGLVTLNKDGAPEYQSFWGMTAHDERMSFERVMDFIFAAHKKHPDMHVYHYAPYEPSAFKRLMGRYATRERELDSMLRNQKFVDLYGVIRQGMRVGTERYSIKNLEPLYAFAREVDLKEAGRNMRVMEHALELNAPEIVPTEVRAAVEGYNKDDCMSTLCLRDWLEKIRADHIAQGMNIPRPQPPEVEIEDLTQQQALVEELRKKLLKGVPDETSERSAEQQARWLLAYMLDYHRREDKAVWWEYFRLRDLPEEDLFDEPAAITGLHFVARVGEKLSKKGKPTGTVIDRYSYPLQEMELEQCKLKLQDETRWGEMLAVDRAARTVDISKGPSQADRHAKAAFSHTYIDPKEMEASIFGIAERVVEDGGVVVDKGSRDAAARALLLARPPRLKKGKFRCDPDEDSVAYLKRTVLSLDKSVLAVQGPPGSGKTYSGAEMIRELVAAGKKVGIAATGHKVVRNLLEAIELSTTKAGSPIALGQKADDSYDGTDAITMLAGNPDVVHALASGEIPVVGGTAWLWSRDDMVRSVDVLFVDEAGQMSLANVLAMSRAADSIVLLGDPQQLEQPRKGSHPDGVGISALEHMLAGHETISNDRGVFLPVTWRLCPRINDFTSELFYESRLKPKPGLERQRLNTDGAFDGTGLWVVPASHDGNRTSSIEEIDIVESIVGQLTAKGVTCSDENGNKRQLRAADILVVAPYNAQVSRLIQRLGPTGARIGTVDKFQGQEAPVVIYSMATSRPEDAPRGMEFLYSINRLNVATSRARCVAIVVANERLFEPECRTPRQMRLANALCRYRELAVV